MHLDLKKKLTGLEIVQIIAAAGLFLTPWALDYTDVASAAWSAWLTAAATVVLAALVSADEPEWAGWGTLAAGIWAIVSSVVLGFTATYQATWSHLVAGGVVTLAAVAMLWLTSRRTTQTA
jgi:hypothetical protein